MRRAMKTSVCNMLERYQNTALLLLDIGAYGFRDVMEHYQGRIKNIGIFEPGTISIASGMALAGMVPVVYGISPFIVQRSLEQLKLDFIYQDLGGNFITTGASYDFSRLGYSHYCPEDILTLKTLPGMEILTPGTPKQFETLFWSCCMDEKPSYFRMSDHCSHTEAEVAFGQACVFKQGSRGIVIVFAELLDAALKACADMDVTILYYTTAEPFDYKTLRSFMERQKDRQKVFLCHPFYEGTFDADVRRAASGLSGYAVQMDEAGVPLEVLRVYGTKQEKDAHLGLTACAIRKKIAHFLDRT